MTIGSIQARSQQTVQSLLGMRQQLDALQEQLGTGKKSTTYAGLGVDSALSVGLHAQLATLSGYGSTMAIVNTTLSVAQTALSGMKDVAGTIKRGLLDPYQNASAGQTNAQLTARAQLDQLLDTLNVKAGERSLFSGRALDTAAVESASHILDGNGARAGLKRLIDERRQADMGADGLGRLAIPAANGASISLSEDAAPSSFGFKLAGAQTDIAGASVTGPSGSPPQVSVDLSAATPAAGQSVTFTLALPDGSTQALKLTATASATPGEGEFAIGADNNATAASLQGALRAGIAAVATTTLPAASALAAAQDFFDADNGHPPHRVAGPPFASATALRAGTAADTVIWYTGEAGTDPARGTAAAKIDPSLSVSYGMRANESAIRALVSNVAVFAATTVPGTGADAAKSYAALTDRVRAGVNPPAGAQSIDDIANDIASAQSAIKTTGERHTQTQSVVNALLDHVEGVPQEQVAAQILALQTRLQASLQASAKLFQLSLTNYL